VTAQQLDWWQQFGVCVDLTHLQRQVTGPADIAAQRLGEPCTAIAAMQTDDLSPLKTK